MNDDKLNSQERIMAIVEALAARGREGLTNKDLIVALEVSAPNICRDLALLERRGWVERTVGGTWRLTPKFAGFSGQIAQSFREARLRLTEDEARFATALQ